VTLAITMTRCLARWRCAWGREGGGWHRRVSSSCRSRLTSAESPEAVFLRGVGAGEGSSARPGFGTICITTLAPQVTQGFSGVGRGLRRCLLSGLLSQTSRSQLSTFSASCSGTFLYDTSLNTTKWLCSANARRAAAPRAAASGARAASAPSAPPSPSQRSPLEASRPSAPHLPSSAPVPRSARSAQDVSSSAAPPSPPSAPPPPLRRRYCADPPRSASRARHERPRRGCPWAGGGQDRSGVGGSLLGVGATVGDTVGGWLQQGMR